MVKNNEQKVKIQGTGILKIINLRCTTDKNTMFSKEPSYCDTVKLFHCSMLRGGGGGGGGGGGRGMRKGKPVFL